MSYVYSRLATNFGVFLSQLARMYKVYLAAFSLPRLWEMGCLCHGIMLCLSVPVQRRDLSNAQSFNSFLRDVI